MRQRPRLHSPASLPNGSLAGYEPGGMHAGTLEYPGYRNVRGISGLRRLTGVRPSAGRRQAPAHQPARRPVPYTGRVPHGREGRARRDAPGGSRELFEETCVRAELLAGPATVAVRSFRPTGRRRSTGRTRRSSTRRARSSRRAVSRQPECGSIRNGRAVFRATATVCGSTRSGSPTAGRRGSADLSRPTGPPADQLGRAVRPSSTGCGPGSAAALRRRRHRHRVPARVRTRNP